MLLRLISELYKMNKLKSDHNNFILKNYRTEFHIYIVCEKFQ